MALTDYQEILHRLQKAVGESFLETPTLFNVPGQSVALKLDANYFLALSPGFSNFLARKTALLPARVQECLVKTGSVVTQAPDRNPVVTVTAVHRGKKFTLLASFVLSDFIERSLQLYANLSYPLETSDVRICTSSKPVLDALFANKTPLHHLAFSDQ
ncbi:MAG: hypothetical protein PWQ57_3208 [Desulfovibrionales bacterium]|jgi:hypothetical protein|nr:hypothetical protein [Desulfovibrionales bacterium]